MEKGNKKASLGQQIHDGLFKRVSGTRSRTLMITLLRDEIIKPTENQSQEGNSISL